MANTDHFNRDAAFSINVENPDHPEEPDRIQRLLELKGSLVCFCEYSISTILPAEAIDPDRTELSTRHGYQKIHDVGSRSPFVSRSILQVHEILQSVVLRNEPDKHEILDLVWNVTEHLLECEKSLHAIYTEVVELMPICDNTITETKSASHIPTLPQVSELKARVGAFLGNGKRALEKIHRLLCIFLQAPYLDSNFRSYRDWMRRHRSDQSEIVELLDRDEPWISHLADARNALDSNHSKPRYEVIIENFKLRLRNRFSAPCWRFDFSDKNRGKQDEETDLLLGLDAMLNNILGFLEELFILCVRTSWDDRFPFKLCRLPNDKIKKECPIPFFISMNRD